MSKLSGFILALCASLLWGCSDPRSRAEETLRAIGAEAVRKDAAVLYKQLFAGRGTDFIVVRASQWPASFKRFEPIRVGAYPDGLSLALRVDADEESGLYVVPLHMDHTPSGAAGARFHKLADGIYWYSFAD